MTWPDRIVMNENTLAGKPVIRGTRISVELVMDMLARGWSQKDVLAEFPFLSEADIIACFAYASELLKSEQVFLKAGN